MVQLLVNARSRKTPFSLLFCHLFLRFEVRQRLEATMFCQRGRSLCGIGSRWLLFSFFLFSPFLYAIGEWEGERMRKGEAEKVWYEDTAD